MWIEHCYPYKKFSFQVIDICIPFFILRHPHHLQNGRHIHCTCTCTCSGLSSYMQSNHIYRKDTHTHMVYICVHKYIHACTCTYMLLEYVAYWRCVHMVHFMKYATLLPGYLHVPGKVNVWIDFNSTIMAPLHQVLAKTYMYIHVPQLLCLSMAIGWSGAQTDSQTPPRL